MKCKYYETIINYNILISEDELKGLESGIVGMKSPIKGNRNRNGSTTEMAVDQLQASEKLIAGTLKINIIIYCLWKL